MHSLGIVIGQNADQALRPFSDHLEVDRYKIFMDPDDVKSMAEHYGLKPTDLNALCEKMGDWRSSEGFVESNRLGYLSTSNPMSKYDWYQIGGRWKRFLTLKVPKRSKWWFLGGKPVVAVDTASIDEIDVLDLKTKEPAFVLIDGQWLEGNKRLSETLAGKPDEIWQRQFREIIDRIPSGSLVTVVDIHS